MARSTTVRDGGAEGGRWGNLGTEDCGRDARQTQQRARDITFGLFVAMAMATICTCTRTLRDVG